MPQYVLAITREGIKSGLPTVPEFRKTVCGIRGLYPHHDFARTVTVSYGGSAEDLRRELGYTPQQVHVEDVILHPPDARQ